MTAEIAILNKIGVALAADSLVTIASHRGSKTYNSANKLFTLSKFHPVGILTYGVTEVNSVPFEIVVKEFRESLKEESRPTLEDYSNDFVDFISKFSAKDTDAHEKNFANIAYDHMHTIRARFNRECNEKTVIMRVGNVTNEMQNALDLVLDNLETSIANSNPYAGLTSLTAIDILGKYPDVASKAFDYEFDEFSPNSVTKDRVLDLVAKWILSNDVSGMACGIAIAGYGSNEYYPSIIDHETEGNIGDVFKIISQPLSKIDNDHRSEILGFAQDAPVRLFVRGVDPGYQRFIDEGINELLPGMADEMIQYFSVIDQAQKDALIKIFRDNAAKFIRDMSARRREAFIKPVFDTVEMLDKPELAVFAENLVNLVALKHKVSLDLETVGGPIDVAVISKHEGFVWIKRKLYFPEELNRSFFSNYLKTRA